MIGRPDTKFELFNYLKEISHSLDDALKKAFDFIKSQCYYTFESDMELKEMKSYLKILLLKSNAGVIFLN